MKKKFNIMIFTFLMLIAVSTSYCPETHSYFYSEGNLVFNSAIEKNTHASQSITPLERPDSTEEYAKFRFQFIPSLDLVNDYNYEIDITPASPACRVTNNPLLEYKANDPRNRVTIEMTCEVGELFKNGDKANLSVDIYEYRNNNIPEEKEPANSYIYRGTKADYDKLVKDPESQNKHEIDLPDNEEELNKIDFYNQFTKWLEEYIESHEQAYDYLIVYKSGDDRSYVNSIFNPTEKERFNSEIKKLVGSNNDENKSSYLDIPGINIKHENDKVTFEIQDNLLEAAKTHYININTANDNKIYIYLSDSANINFVFKYYLKNYIYPNSDNQAITNIIDKIGTIKIDSNGNICNNSGIINGIDISVDAEGNKNRYRVNKIILGVGENNLPFSPKNADGTSKKTYVSVVSIQQALQTFKYLDTPFMTNAFITEIFSKAPFVKTILKGTDNTAPTLPNIPTLEKLMPYKDYFIYQDTNSENQHYVLFKMWAENDLTNNIQAFPILKPVVGENEDMTISFKNDWEDGSENNDKFDIIMEYTTTETDKSKVVDKFNETLNSFKDFIDEARTLSIDNVEDSVNGKYTVTLRINKNVVSTMSVEEEVLSVNALPEVEVSPTEEELTTPPKDNKPISEEIDSESTETPIGSNPPENISDELPLVVVNKAEVLEDFKKAAIETDNEDILDYKVIPAVKLAGDGEYEIGNDSTLDGERTKLDVRTDPDKEGVYDTNVIEREEQTVDLPNDETKEFSE